jgi:hypothetical protein
LDTPEREVADEPEIEVLKPVHRPILQPRKSETATISPVKTSILTPTSIATKATLTPVKATLTPQSSTAEEEE